MGKKKSVNVSLSAEAYENIAKQAEKESRSISNMLEYTARLYLERLEKEKKALI